MTRPASGKRGASPLFSMLQTGSRVPTQAPETEQQERHDEAARCHGCAIHDEVAWKTCCNFLVATGAQNLSAPAERAVRDDLVRSLRLRPSSSLTRGQRLWKAFGPREQRCVLKRTGKDTTLTCALWFHNRLYQSRGQRKEQGFFQVKKEHKHEERRLRETEKR